MSNGSKLKSILENTLKSFTSEREISQTFCYNNRKNSSGRAENFAKRKASNDKKTFAGKIDEGNNEINYAELLQPYQEEISEALEVIIMKAYKGKDFSENDKVKSPINNDIKQSENKVLKESDYCNCHSCTERRNSNNKSNRKSADKNSIQSTHDYYKSSTRRQSNASKNSIDSSLNKYVLNGFNSKRFDSLNNCNPKYRESSMPLDNRKNSVERSKTLTINNSCPVCTFIKSSDKQDRPCNAQKKNRKRNVCSIIKEEAIPKCVCQTKSTLEDDETKHKFCEHMSLIGAKRCDVYNKLLKQIGSAVDLDNTPVKNCAVIQQVVNAITELHQLEREENMWCKWINTLLHRRDPKCISLGSN